MAREKGVVAAFDGSLVAGTARLATGHDPQQTRNHVGIGSCVATWPTDSAKSLAIDGASPSKCFAVEEANRPTRSMAPRHRPTLTANRFDHSEGEPYR